MSHLRALTLDHALRLQSFPPGFTLRGSTTSQQKQVGNAVPPRLAYDVGCALRTLLLGGRVAPVGAKEAVVRLKQQLSLLR